MPEYTLVLPHTSGIGHCFILYFIPSGSEPLSCSGQCRELYIFFCYEENHQEYFNYGVIYRFTVGIQNAMQQPYYVF